MLEPYIETERLILRRWRDDDRTPFAAMCSDPDVMRYIGDGSTRSIEQAGNSIDSFEKEWAEKGYGLFAVELKYTGKLIGFTGLSWPDFLPEILPSVEIGWRFDRRSWGNGYATEAAIAALSFGVNDLRITDIVSICQTGNDASERIMHRLGMTFDRKTVDPSCNRQVHVYRLQIK
jgi:RimJ/RimL family protein N-acetyltransferase